MDSGMLPPSMMLRMMTEEQLTAFEDRLVERITTSMSVNWLPRRPMTPEELAEYMQVSRETVRRWTISGAIACWQHGHTILYLPDEIARFLGRGHEAT